MKANMITHQDVKFSENAIYCFRKNISVNSIKSAKINISADARYKLWINGELIAIGPCKGSEKEKYYDEIDIAEYLKDGENEIFAKVLQLTSCQYPDGHRFLCSVYRTGAMMLAVWGEYEDKDGVKELKTDSSWECARDESISFEVPKYAFYAGIDEIKKSDAKLLWSAAKESAPVLYKEQTEPLFYGEIGNWFMTKRPIPMMKLEKKRMKNIRDNIYDAGEFTTGFVSIKLKGSGGAKLVYGECFVKVSGGQEIKGQRDDISGEIRGDSDIVYIDGSTEYETFWFKTFRYIDVQLWGDVVIEDIWYNDMRYPLEVADDYDFGDKSDNELWEMSVRTLQRCMHETYEDCPYYEQLQYVYDTSIQILFTYKLTNDDALARKLIEDFARSYHFKSTVQSRFPSASIQYIAEFPLFFIIMVHDHYKNYADEKFTFELLHIIDGIILWYKNNMGVGGLIERTIYWEYIDWADGWDDNRGCPGGYKALTVENMLFVKALECAGYLNSVFGREDTAKEYAELRKQTVKNIKEQCFDAGSGLYFDSADRMSYSQHPQMWAVLCDMAEGAEAKRMMEKSFELKAQAAFGYTYYLFKALEKAGLSDRKADTLKDLKRLITLGCTTIPETPTNSRSECHGWGAVAIYEFTQHVLGVSVEDAKTKKVVICPDISGREYARGKVATKWGYIYVDWKKEKNRFLIHVDMPEKLKAKLILPDGSEQYIQNSSDCSCAI